MFRTYRLFEVLGIPVLAHGSLLVFVVILGFLFRRADTPLGILLAVGFIGLVLGFVLLHELGHCVAAMRYGIRTRSILLTPIGGLAALERLPTRPRQELVVYLAGPAVNFALAGVFFLLAELLAYEFLWSLLWVNLVLGGFNLLPAFPLDGGRVLRAILAMKLSHLRATTIAVRVAQVLAAVFCIAAIRWGHLTLLLIAAFVFLYSQAELLRARASAHPLGAMGAFFDAMRGGASRETTGPGPEARLREDGSSHDASSADAPSADDASADAEDCIIDVGPDGVRRVWRRGVDGRYRS